MTNVKDHIIDDIFDASLALYSASKLKLRDKELAKKAEKYSFLQTHKEHRINKKKFHKIVAKDLLSSVQVDLADFSQLHTVNKGVNYLFCIVDVHCIEKKLFSARSMFFRFL